MRTSSKRAQSYAGPPAEPTVIGAADGVTGARLGPARLIVVNGALAGATTALGHDDTTIGRGRANDIVLPDVSVSRRHAVLRREGSGYVVVDRASGNGTRINGRSIHTARLRDGDEIALGDSLVQFVDAGGMVARTSVAARVAFDVRSARRPIPARAWAAIGVPLLATIVVASLGKHPDSWPRVDVRVAQPAAPVEPIAVQPDAQVAAPAPHSSRAVPDANASVASHRRRGASAAATQPSRARTVRPATESRLSLDDARDRSTPEHLEGAAAEANDAYLRGYVAKDIDEDAAREAFRSVVELLPANDPTARKARRWLDRLDGKAGEED
jgi:hypothetical protein